MRRNPIAYYKRVFSAYLTGKNSQLTFWHEVPEASPNFSAYELGEYYMTFAAKADYPGPYDAHGIPMLNYHGSIGLQYNPIAIAQYGLGNYNQMRRTGEALRRQKFLKAADWLVTTLECNTSGFAVWNHHFDWEYRTTLRAPWFSGLAQGQGISLLVRAARETEDALYFDAATRAFACFRCTTDEGGVSYRDADRQLWFEEYIVSPPTHILNGFIWACWGVYDYFLATRDSTAGKLFAAAVQTLKKNLPVYDTRFWSLYEQSGTWLQMLASPFYHQLHIVQLEVMHRLTGETIFADYARRWDEYRRSPIKRARAFAHKCAFKLIYY